MKNNLTSKKFSLKDHLFNADRVGFLARQFSAAVPGFDESGFTHTVMQQLGNLELKQRIVLIAETLEHHLSNNFSIAAQQIKAALPPELDPKKTDDDFGDFIIAPLGEFVVRRGMDARHLSLSLKTLQEITKRFSMEDALRRFINQHPEQTLKELAKWTTNKNYHVRRLVSESTRPRLPWSGRLLIDYHIPIPMLDQLHADPTRYVTRSVANHLNDIAKNDPAVVLTTLRRWHEQGKQRPEELDWMCRHALRTLIKQGHTETMEFLGLRTKPRVKVSPIELKQTSLTMGEALEFTVTITAQGNESLVVDYVIDFVKANGSLAPRVFKAKKLEIKQGESVILSKRHPLKANATTYRLFPGTHHLTIQINGVASVNATFEMH